MNETDWVNHQINGYAHGDGWTVTRQSLSQDRFQFVREQLAQFVPPPADVLDVGCNDGAFCHELADLGYDPIGVDFPESLEKIQTTNPRCRWYAQQLDQPYVEPMLYGCHAVVALEILEHCLHDFALVRYCVRSLRPGGYLFLSVPKKSDIQADDHHIRYYPEHSMRKLLQFAGCVNTVLEGREHSLCVRTQRGD